MVRMCVIVVKDNTKASDSRQCVFILQHEQGVYISTISYDIVISEIVGYMCSYMDTAKSVLY